MGSHRSNVKEDTNQQESQKQQEGWAAAGPRLCYAKYMCRHWKAGIKPWPQTRKPRDEFWFPTSCNMLLAMKLLAEIGIEASQCSAYCPLSWFILLELFLWQAQLEMFSQYLIYEVL